MSSNPSPQPKPNLVYRSETEPRALLAHLSAIVSLANREKEALSFLPYTAYREAIGKRRLVAMLAIDDNETKLVGFVLFSGVYPNARIQQIVVDKRHRRAHVASSLLNEVVSQLEVRGYLTLTAAVASDLPAAQAFYEHNGFIAKTSRQGGKTRNRQIILRARNLQTPSLFSMLEPSSLLTGTAVDLGLRHRGAGHAPLYAIDLNVLFDITKQPPRPRAILAERLITAALAHQVRLAVAPEFIVELRRQAHGQTVDPILRLALQLPRLPASDQENTERMTAELHQLIFEGSGSADAGTPQAWSDARHLAEAALANAIAYVTSDGTILAARQEILQSVGIDVCSLEEFAEILPGESTSSGTLNLKESGVSLRDVSLKVVRSHLVGSKLPESLLSKFTSIPADPTLWKGRAIFERDEIVAVAVYIAAVHIDAPARVLLHVRPDHVYADRFADHLLDVGVRKASRHGPVTIELPIIPGQTTVRQFATLRGFVPDGNTGLLIKAAIGRPVTPRSWSAIARQLRLRTALQLPDNPPPFEVARSETIVRTPDGIMLPISLERLEDALGPTLLVLTGRDGVILPITREYADALLDTGIQMPLFGDPVAALLSQRTYFNTPRAAKLMRPRTPILFYESKRSGGRGQIVAAARILDSMVVFKDRIPNDLCSRAVVEDVDALTKSSEILVTRFDNLLQFPMTVSLETLRALGAVGSSNLQTATSLRSNVLSEILELGWE